MCTAEGSWDMEAKALALPRLQRARNLWERLTCVSPFSRRQCSEGDHIGLGLSLL